MPQRQGAPAPLPCITDACQSLGPRTALARAGHVALERGPLVYAVEGADSSGDVRQLFLPPGEPLAAVLRDGLLGGCVILRAKARALEQRADGPRVIPAVLTAVPFFLRAHREPGPVRVWLPESALGAAPVRAAEPEAGDGR